MRNFPISWANKLLIDLSSKNLWTTWSYDVDIEKWCGNLLSNCHCNIELLSKTWIYFPFISAKQHENLVLSFNMAVLGLTLLKNLSNSSTAIDVSESKRFVGAVLRMFAGSHQLGNSGRCEVTPVYKQHWDDIEALWLLGMQCKVMSFFFYIFIYFIQFFFRYENT